MAARTKARKRALDLLFEADQRGVNALQLLRERLAAPVTEAPLNEFTVTLVEGVVERWSDLDEVITTYAQGWSLERMPAVDRNVLRLGVYELLYVDDIPDGVAVTEAMNLVRDLSTDESPAFVNGVLGTILRTR